MKEKFAKIIIDEHGANYFSWSMVADGFFKLPYIKRFLELSFDAEIIIMEGEHGRWAANPDNILALAESSLRKMKNGSYQLAEIERLHKYFGKKVLARCKKLEEAISLKNDYLAKELEKVWQDFMRLNCLGFVVVFCDVEYALLTKHLEKILLKKFLPADQAQEIMSLLITPTMPTKVWHEKKSLLKIAKKYKTYQQAVISKNFKKHVKKYASAQYGYKGPALTAKYFSDALKKIYNNSPFRQYQEHLNYFKKIHLKQILIEKKLGLTGQERKLFYAAKKIMRLKAYRVDIRHYFHWVMDGIFKRLSKQYHIPLAWFHYADREEILKFIRTGAANLNSGLKRSRFLLRVTEKNKVKFVEKNKAKMFLKKVLIEESATNRQEISGNVAFPGKAIGKARIIFSSKDLNKVNRGDILIATTTNPDLLPAMEKAAAFVTDQGGITSHAAIVAREMKKPCVIGTRVATKVLRDGDLVEVDANKGVVHLRRKATADK
ncbi:hypothetical protein HY797_01655 [Candidatus Falkowbacteria bacterium]|nr:hypothetical protein [Candidatus Falkowbacteria bacterium]